MDATQMKRLATMLAKLSEEDRAALLAPYLPAPAPARQKAPKVTRECLCGCGSPTSSKFAPGHDSKLKGTLLRAHRTDGLTTEQVALVEELGWGRIIYAPAPVRSAPAPAEQPLAEAPPSDVRSTGEKMELSDEQ